MYTKYEIKTYPDNPSKIEPRYNYIPNTIKNTQNITSEKGETTFQTKCVFTKKNNNISFYQSSSTNSVQKSKYEKKADTENITPIMKTKNKIYTIKNINERNEENTIQNISYNYSDMLNRNDKKNNRTIKNNINNINININPNTNNFNFNDNSAYNNAYIDNNKPKNINLKQNIIKRNKKKPKTKSCKKQYDVQKRDDFNVLSYKQPENDNSEINNTTMHKNKIIKLYKKQEVEEIFFPSKRTHSPTITNKAKEIEGKYQTHTLKYQNFFGSFNITKPGQMMKSFSRKKINNLNDFNIDKLIEIGDRYANLNQPVLPLGKIMNNSILFFNQRIKKNRFQIPINTYNNCFNYSKYSKRTYNKEIEYDNENKENISPIYINDTNRVTKKLVAKNNFKNSKLTTLDKDEESEMQKILEENTIRKNLNFKNYKQNHKNKIVINNKGNKSKITNRRRNIQNDSVCLRKQKSYDNSINNNNNLGEAIPRRKFQKISCDLNIEDNNINSKYIIFNKNNMKIKEKSKEKKEKLLTDKETDYIRKCFNQNNKKEIVLDTIVNKRNHRYNSKNYYGYDDRHNLEGTINNHVYYESLNYKKL